MRSTAVACCFVALSVISAQAPSPGTIVAVVRWAGPVPGPATITVTDGTTIQHRDVAVDAKTKGVRDVVAILQDAPAQPKLKDAKAALMDQKDWIFTPRVIVVQHGQPVRFDNGDTVNHSVMATSTLAENQFNSVAGPGMPITHAFAPQKLPVMIGCSIHPWMRSWIYVVPHPWFGVSDAQGKVRITNVPAGKYSLLLVHPDTNRREVRSVEVKAGQVTELSVELRETK